MKNTDKVTLTVRQLKKLVKESIDDESLSDITYSMTYNDSFLGDYVDRIDHVCHKINNDIAMIKDSLANKNFDKDKIIDILNKISERL